MAMEVTVENQFGFMHESRANHHWNLFRGILGEKPFDHFSRVPNGWIGILENGFVISIQIPTGQGTSVVSNDHSIRIEHGNNFKDKVIAQKLNKQTSIVLVRRWALARSYFSIGRITEKKVEETFHHPRSIGFSWMYTGSDYHPFLHALFGRCRWIGCGRTGDRQHVDKVTR